MAKWRLQVVKPVHYEIDIYDFEPVTIRAALHGILGQQAYKAEIEVDSDLAEGQVFGHVKGVRHMIASFKARRLEGDKDDKAK